MRINIKMILSGASNHLRQSGVKSNIHTFSLSEYCHSALSYRTSFCLLPVASSSSNEYVGSGGKNASLAAILEGHGGQQNKQHNSENDSPIPLIMINITVAAPLISVASLHKPT